MKKILILLTLIYTLNNLAQNINVLYSSHIDLPKKAYLKFYTDKALKHLKEKKYYQLIKNDSVSIFFPLKKGEQYEDIDTTIVSKYQTKINKVVIDSRIVDIYYINYPKSKYIRKINLRGENFDIKDHLPQLKWHITDSVSRMHSYIIQKATTTYHNIPITAWFTEDIPVSIGPRIFQGLPGLIMKLKMNSLNYEVEKITFLKKTPPISPPEPKGNYLTAEQFLKTSKSKRHKSRIIKKECATCPKSF
ncbi:MAG TPA: GLPGLI family protein [Flavobacteriales bacterium]|nr:GLPGLI family protein [Flavobacteriales bacterium]